MAAPNLTDLTAAVNIALRAARAPAEAQETMRDFLYSSAKTKDGSPYYRPWEAAARWVESDRRAVLKYKQGVTLANPTDVAASLRQQQQEEDAKAQLDGEAAASSFPFVGAAR